MLNIVSITDLLRAVHIHLRLVFNRTVFMPCIGIVAVAVYAQEPGTGPQVQADLTPIVDTLWTHTRFDFNAFFEACAMGGVPQALIIAVHKVDADPGFKSLYADVSAVISIS